MQRSWSVIAIAVAVCGCGTKTQPAAPVAGGALFVVARPTVMEAAVPARFTAALPATVAELETPERTPPRPLIKARLEAGDAEMRRKVLDALTRASAGGALDEDVARYYEEIIGWSAGPLTCDWLREVAVGAGPMPVRRWAFTGLAHCKGPGLAEVFARDDAPDAAVIAWASAQEEVPFTDRLARAARGVAAAGDTFAARLIGFVFAKTGDDRAVEAMIALQKTVTDPRVRAEIALGMVEHPSPRAQELGRAACREPAVKRDPMCTADPDDRYVGDPAADEAGDPPASGLDPAVAARLDALGFAQRPDAAPAEPIDDVALTLETRGWALSFDAETDRYPNEHDELLADLARLVRPALDGVVFEEVPPPNDQGIYILRAYVDGKRYQLGARNHGDWYDLGAVVGLLNALLVARGSDLRVVVGGLGDGQVAQVIAGKAASIEALVAEKLIEVAPPDGAMSDGKAFERQVIEQLRREGR